MVFLKSMPARLGLLSKTRLTHFGSQLENTRQRMDSIGIINLNVCFLALGVVISQTANQLRSAAAALL